MKNNIDYKCCNFPLPTLLSCYKAYFGKFLSVKSFNWLHIQFIALPQLDLKNYKTSKISHHNCLFCRGIYNFPNNTNTCHVPWHVPKFWHVPCVMTRSKILTRAKSKFWHVSKQHVDMCQNNIFSTHARILVCTRLILTHTRF